MKQEPIKFLPVDKCWIKTRPGRTVERALCVGIVIGCVFTVLAAVILIHLCK